MERRPNITKTEANRVAIEWIDYVLSQMKTTEAINEKTRQENLEALRGAKAYLAVYGPMIAEAQ